MIQSETGMSDVFFEKGHEGQHPHRASNGAQKIKGRLKANGISRQLATSDCGTNHGTACGNTGSSGSSAGSFIKAVEAVKANGTMNKASSEAAMTSISSSFATTTGENPSILATTTTSKVNDVISLHFKSVVKRSL